MKNILIVDDDRKIRELYARLLVSEGFDVVEAANAEYGHDEILRRENIDLILLDIEMPVARGDILYETIRAFHKNVKVIVTSVYPLDEQERIIPEAADYYDKSYGIDVLLSKIKKVLKTI